MVVMVERLRRRAVCSRQDQFSSTVRVDVVVVSVLVIVNGLVRISVPLVCQIVLVVVLFVVVAS